MPEPSQRGCSRSASAFQPFQSPITDTARVGCPHREMRALRLGMKLTAQVFVQARVRAFAEQVDVVAGQHVSAGASHAPGG